METAIPNTSAPPPPDTNIVPAEVIAPAPEPVVETAPEVVEPVETTEPTAEAVEPVSEDEVPADAAQDAEPAPASLEMAENEDLAAADAANPALDAEDAKMDAEAQDYVTSLEGRVERLESLGRPSEVSLKLDTADYQHLLHDMIGEVKSGIAALRDEFSGEFNRLADHYDALLSEVGVQDFAKLPRKPLTADGDDAKAEVAPDTGSLDARVTKLEMQLRHFL